MPTEKPRVTITMSQDQLARIDEYRFANKLKNQTQAILTLIEAGIEQLSQTVEGEKKKAPTLSDEAAKLAEAYDSAPEKERGIVRYVLSEYIDRSAPLHIAARTGIKLDPKILKGGRLSDKNDDIPL